MNDSPDLRTPPALLGAIVFGVLLTTLFRGASSHEGSPVFLRPSPSVLVVEVSAGFPSPGVYQFYDDTDWQGVTEMTLPGEGKNLSFSPRCPPQPVAGLILNLSRVSENNHEIQCGWMAASRRVAMGIRLHPDRMSEQDWQVLPGIGPVLARNIEKDRQLNGDFVHFEALQRVNGIGPKRIEAWSEFF